MSQIETADSVTRLPPGMLPRLFLAGAIIAGNFFLASSADSWKKKTGPDRRRKAFTLENACRRMDRQTVRNCKGGRRWSIYFTFGYYIAWKNAAVRVYYGGSDPGKVSLSRHEFCAAGYALAHAAPSSACDTVDSYSGAGHPHDERSVVGVLG